MKNIEEIDVRNKTVILRADLNVSIKDGKIISDKRIISSLKTIKYLLNQNAKIIILSHLGKIKTSVDTKTNSLLVVYERLEELLPEVNIYFSPITKGIELDKAVERLNSSEILLIENTRFEDLDNKKESTNDLELAKYWASLGEVLIDDAFGMTHRRHASNYGIKKFLPSAYGFLIKEELLKLENLINPISPFTIVMGGAKVEDKSLLINNILNKCNYLLLGGGIANTFLAVNNEIGESLASYEYIETAKELLSKYPNKIILPIDVVTSSKQVIKIKNIKDINKEDKIYDLGPETIKLYQKYIESSETIFINGTVGLYEDDRFKNGTKEILEISQKSKGKTILGGGDAVASSEHFKINDFYHLSTGGGATLDYIAAGKLKSMED